MAEQLREPGDRVWFEYHCWESFHSADAELWLRSHRQVEIMSPALWDDKPVKQPTLKSIGRTMADRGYNGCPLGYRIRFDDGKEFYATEDELLDSITEFQRPDPPKRKGNNGN